MGMPDCAIRFLRKATAGAARTKNVAASPRYDTTGYAVRTMGAKPKPEINIPKSVTIGAANTLSPENFVRRSVAR